jgi:hypothetical protein
MLKLISYSLIMGFLFFLFPFFFYNDLFSLFGIDVVYTNPSQSGVDSILCGVGFFLLGFFLFLSCYWLDGKSKVMAYIALSMIVLVLVFILKGVVFLPVSGVGVLASDLKLYLIPFYALSAVFVMFCFLRISSIGHK